MSTIPLYAIFTGPDAWIICREPAPSVWAALDDRIYVGTEYSPLRPLDWFGQPVIDAREALAGRT